MQKFRYKIRALSCGSEWCLDIGKGCVLVDGWHGGGTGVVAFLPWSWERCLQNCVKYMFALHVSKADALA